MCKELHSAQHGKKFNAESIELRVNCQICSQLLKVFFNVLNIKAVMNGNKRVMTQSQTAV